MKQDLMPVAIKVTEMARLMDVSRATAYRWTKMAGFPAIKIGGCTRVLVDDLKEWVQNQV